MIIQIGNFQPPHSTENELRKALQALNETVVCVQEGDVTQWQSTLQLIPEATFVLWTRTASELNKIPLDDQTRFVEQCRKHDVPVVGYHLDIWFGLKRQKEITTVPYFKMVDVMCTADGGHEEQFAEAGVNHWWFPPAISEFECGKGEFDSKYESDIVFVGAHTGEYHKESAHRFQLVEWLKRKGCKFWPQPGQPAVRGQELKNLYASTKIAVGDSCDVSPKNYWSDRIPETIGRHCVLLHPHVEGLDEHFVYDQEIVTWTKGDWNELDHKINQLLDSPEKREKIASQGEKRVREDHTYTVRMAELWDALSDEGYI